jgi:hypothetical protein
MNFPSEEDLRRQSNLLSTLTVSGANNVLGPDQRALIFNAGVQGTAKLDEKVFEGSPRGLAQATEFITDLVGRPTDENFRLLNEGDLCDLGDALATLATKLTLAAHDLVIFPLRGGHKLQLALEGMMESHPNFRSVPFSEAATGKNKSFYAENLAQRIHATNLGNDWFRIAVVDVGDGGHGTEKMRELLEELHDQHYALQNWDVQFNVFHHHEHPDRFTRYERIHPRLVFTVNTYRTETELLDDWIAALGLTKVKQRFAGAIVNVPSLKEAIRPAAVIIYSKYTGYRALASSSGIHVANRLISDASTQALATSPHHRRNAAFDKWKLRAPR